jgi:hypothetical protein
MRQAHHCGNAAKARHFIAAERLMKDLFHGTSSHSFVELSGLNSGAVRRTDKVLVRNI